jgi:hypothetical protein
MWRKRTLKNYWWECKLVQPLWKAIWRLLKKLKIKLPYNPAIPLLVYTQRNVSDVIVKTLVFPCL